MIGAVQRSLIPTINSRYQEYWILVLPIIPPLSWVYSSEYMEESIMWFLASLAFYTRAFASALLCYTALPCVPPSFRFKPQHNKSRFIRFLLVFIYL